MKIIITLLCIAVMVEVSQAGTIERNRQSAWDNNDFKVFSEKSKLWFEQTKIIIKAVVEDLPTKAEYNGYRDSYKRFLEQYENHKNKFESCLGYMLRLTEDIAELCRPIDEVDCTAEDKEFRKLFLKHGLKDLGNEIKEFFITFKKETLERSVQSLKMEGKC